MTPEAFMMAYELVSKRGMLMEDMRFVERDEFTVTICNRYQDKDMLAIIKEGILNELGSRVSEIDNQLLKMGFVID